MSTNGAFASYQEVIDLHTESDKVSVIGIHTPTNFVPHKMFGGFFKQFKKFKYNGCSVKLVPAARLPADPLQVSYEAGETTIDPRDMLNPLMFHGCHGNDLGMILNKLYSINTVSGSDGIYLDNGVDMWQATQFDADGPLLESLYYKALTDNTWKKAHPQRGFRKAGLRPLVYQLATNVQFDGAHAWQSGGDYGEFFAESGMPIPSTDSNTGDVWDITSSVRDNMRVFTPKLTSLGWMDTYNVLTTGKFTQVDVSDAADADEANAMINEGLFDVLKSQESMATLPRIYMGVILLPPAYKTEQYFRMIVTHHFSFKQFRGISFSNDIMETPAYSNWNDVDNATEDSSDPIDPDIPGGGGDFPTPEPEPDPEPEPVTYSVALSERSSSSYTMNGQSVYIYKKAVVTPSSGDSFTLECDVTSYKYYGFVPLGDAIYLVYYNGESSNGNAFAWRALSTGQDSSRIWCAFNAFSSSVSTSFNYNGNLGTLTGPTIRYDSAALTVDQQTLISVLFDGVNEFTEVSI